MTLGNKRRKFSRMVWRLLQEAERQGYGFAIDFVKRCESCPIGHAKSTHKVGLAMDLHLYDDNGTYLSSGAEHESLHDFWDQLGGSERIKNDLNHYSLQHNGVR